MHALNLGYCLWASGSCLRILMDQGTWGDSSVSDDLKLQRAWRDFIRWAKTMKVEQLG